MSDEASGLKQDRKNLLNRALAMAQGTLTSRILGLFRDVAMGALFDRGVTDAWVAAFRLPNFFRRLLGEGLIAGAFIPLYIEAQASDPTGVKAQRFYSLVVVSLASFMGLLTALAFLYMEPLLQLLLEASNFSQNKWQWTVTSARIMFGFVWFVSISAVWSAFIQLKGRYIWVGLAPAFLNISMLVFTFLPQAWFLFPGESLAWGVCLGGLLQAVVLGVVARQQGHVLSWNWQGSFGLLRKFYRTVTLSVLGVGIFQISNLIHLYFASGFTEGALSAIYWADRLIELPLALVSVTLGASLLSSLSGFAKTNAARFWELSEEALSLSFFWAAPAALGLYLFAEPLVAVLFKRGEFTNADLLRTALVLQIQAGSLIAMALNRVLLPIYYSRKKSQAPMWTSLIGIGLQIGLSVLLLDRSQLDPLVSIMLAGLFANFAVSACLIGGLYGQFAFKRWTGSVVKTILSCSTLLLPYLFYKTWLTQTEPKILTIFLALIIVLSLVLYFITATVLKSPDALRILQSFPLLRGRPRQKE